MISYAVFQLTNIIILIMLIAVFLSWVPNLNREKEPWRSILIFADFFFKPFRKIIPPVGGLDFSPVIAFIAISFISRLLIGALSNVGL